MDALQKLQRTNFAIPFSLYILYTPGFNDDICTSFVSFSKSTWQPLRFSTQIKSRDSENCIRSVAGFGYMVRGSRDLNILLGMAVIISWFVLMGACLIIFVHSWVRINSMLILYQK